MIFTVEAQANEHACKSFNQYLDRRDGNRPVGAFAGEPSTRPVVDPAQGSFVPVLPLAQADVPGQSTPDDANPRTTDRTNTVDNSAGGRNRVGGPGQRQLLPQLPSQDIEEAMQFMKTNSPKRYEALEAMKDGDRKNRLKNQAAHNYIQAIRQAAPALKDVAIKRMKIEDDVFGLTTDLHKPGADKEAITTQLRTKVTELVKIGLEERHIRLTALEETVDEEKQKLAKDTANPNQLIEERMNAILEVSNRGMLGGNPPGAGRGRQGQHQSGDSTPPAQ